MLVTDHERRNSPFVIVTAKPSFFSRFEGSRRFIGDVTVPRWRHKVCSQSREEAQQAARNTLMEEPGRRTLANCWDNIPVNGSLWFHTVAFLCALVALQSLIFPRFDANGKRKFPFFSPFRSTQFMVRFDPPSAVVTRSSHVGSIETALLTNKPDRFFLIIPDYKIWPMVKRSVATCRRGWVSHPRPRVIIHRSRLIPSRDSRMKASWWTEVAGSTRSVARFYNDCPSIRCFFRSREATIGCHAYIRPIGHIFSIDQLEDYEERVIEVFDIRTVCRIAWSSIEIRWYVRSDYTLNTIHRVCIFIRGHRVS